MACAIPSGLLDAGTYWLAPPGTSYTGTPTNCSFDNPIPWTTADVLNIIGNNPKPDGDENTVEVLFRTDFGECGYDIEALESSPPSSRILKLKCTDPAQPAVLRLLPPTTNQGAHPTDLFFGPAGQRCLLWFGSEIDRFECQDVVLDGNWSGWANWGATQYSTNAASPAYMDGFTLSALFAKAKRGLIRRVRVKNCGANGLSPGVHQGGS